MFNKIFNDSSDIVYFIRYKTDVGVLDKPVVVTKIDEKSVSLSIIYLQKITSSLSS